uniref:RING-type E3 ubiquitin transferase n=1 Tax=Plectus sambesii TaxID=2011161 RepID=A0A914V6G6_9BILA
MNSYVAEIPELVRAHRKDQDHIEELSATVSQLVKDAFGPRVWIRYYREVAVAAELVYYATTTLSGLQTLGEEYLSLVQVSDIGRRVVPSFGRRLLFVLLHVFGPYLSERALKSLESRLTLEGTVFGVEPNPIARQSLTSLFRWLSRHSTTLSRLHLALFYIFGVYYHLSKRLTGIRYVSLRPQTSVNALRLFRILGYLTIGQVCVGVGLWLTDQILDAQKKSTLLKTSPQSNVEEAPQRRSLTNRAFQCSVCLETAKAPACTPCGHLFCWDCVIEQAALSGTCPHCRATVAPSRVVPLFNL